MIFEEHIIVLLAGYLIYFASIFSVIFLLWKHDRKHFIRDGLFLLGTAVVSWVVAHIIKDLVAHPRPNIFNPPIIIVDDPYSFPSGHASFMFALAFGMNYFNLKAGLFLLLLALLTGIARVIGGAHYGIDIIGGAVLALIIVTIAFHLHAKLFKK